MTNSSLVNVTKISPNKSSPRNHSIDTITIHCVVGQASVEALGDLFAQASRQASSNYGVGYDGRVGMYVEEKDRSWCSSSASNDNRAITIEVASDTTYPYAVKDKAYYGVIRLVADICKRNGIAKLLWKADKSLIGQVDKQNMTVHRWFANKSCPGDYLYNRMDDIAEKVNAILEGTSYPVLREGFEGDDVKDLQKRLIIAGYDCGSAGADGDFGIGTLSAVKLFQKDNQLDVDGVVGGNTWEALCKDDEGSSGESDTPIKDNTCRVRVTSSRPIYKNCPDEVGMCGNGVYTIVETSDNYGKLKSGVGWIQLDGTEIV